MYLLFIVEGPGQEILQASFSAGDFRSFKKTHTKSSKEATVTEEAGVIRVPKTAALAFYGVRKALVTRKMHQISRKISTYRPS